MNSPASATVADIFNQGFAEYNQRYGPFPADHYKVANAIMACRTEVLGGHIYKCDDCDHELTFFNSCRDRHCPTCQGFASAAWVQKRIDELLPVPYFHVVFTLPHQLNPFFLRNKKICYRILFRAVSETLKVLAADPQRIGGTIGFIAILHSWTQMLLEHYHVHCIVPGGVLDEKKQKWIATKENFLLPTGVMKKMFRGKLLAFFFEAVNNGQIAFPGKPAKYRDAGEMKRLRETLYAGDWVVYSKPPFGSTEQVVKYLGNYTHRIAISNTRIVRVENGRVIFRYRDSKDCNVQKITSLDIVEFIRRFMLHVVPRSFMRIRHYGFLSNRKQKETLPLIRRLISGEDEPQSQHNSDKKRWYEIIEELTGNDPTICPVCKKGKLRAWREIPPVREYLLVA